MKGDYRHFWTEFYKSIFPIFRLMYRFVIAYAVPPSLRVFVFLMILLFFIPPGIKKHRNYCWYTPNTRATDGVARFSSTFEEPYRKGTASSLETGQCGGALREGGDGRRADGSDPVKRRSTMCWG